MRWLRRSSEPRTSLSHDLLVGVIALALGSIVAFWLVWLILLYAGA
jgi:hypothetical protein